MPTKWCWYPHETQGRCCTVLLQGCNQGKLLQQRPTLYTSWPNEGSPPLGRFLVMMKCRSTVPMKMMVIFSRISS